MLPASLRDASFDDALSQHALDALSRTRVTTLQVNVGRLCNLACHHCHVEAGPKRAESLSAEVADRLLELLAASPEVGVLDLTGGAPEMNPEFRRLVAGARALGRRVIDRCNLSILEQPGYEDLRRFPRRPGGRNRRQPPLLHARECRPAARTRHVRRQHRGAAAAERARYGKPRSALRLDLVYNPLGPALPPAQEALELDYKRELGARFGIEFHHLITITNMPIRRFAERLARLGKTASYQALLVHSFNPATVDGLMCRTQVSVDWNGNLYDCDFNLMLEMPLPGEGSAPRRTISEIERLGDLAGSAIATAGHCFGCTAGAGSSCSGALA